MLHMARVALKCFPMHKSVDITFPDELPTTPVADLPDNKGHLATPKEHNPVPGSCLERCQAHMTTIANEKASARGCRVKWFGTSKQPSRCKCMCSR
jgi:hypothetical protein